MKNIYNCIIILFSLFNLNAPLKQKQIDTSFSRTDEKIFCNATITDSL